MELILKKDVENLGFVDDIVNVKPGYGRNFLIPQGAAVMATTGAKKQLAETLKQRAHREKSAVEAAEKEAAKINDLAIKIAAKTAEGTKLFGSVTSQDLIDALAKEGVSLEKKNVTIAGNSVKRTGAYTAKVRLHREVIAALNFEVVPQA